MNIDSTTFESSLPTILNHVAESPFVTIDIEMSGIPKKQTRSRKQTLEERYSDAKAAAEKYHILQVGLTFIKEDRGNGCYILQPYSFYLSQIIDSDKVVVDRDFTYSESASKFLMKNGFNMERPLYEGVPYLSRKEEAEARQKFAAKVNRNNHSTVELNPNDPKNALAMEFVNMVDNAIREWKATASHSSYLDIGQDLSNFEKLLVHQTVRSQYPDLHSMPRNDAVRVKFLDANRENAILAAQYKEFEEALTSQVGLRWVFEAMCPNLERVVPVHLKGPNTSGDLRSISNLSQFAEILDSLKKHKTFLIGHNMLLDLVYLYQTFIGSLPESFEEFADKIAVMFPMVFDTKHLADTLKNDLKIYNSSLSDLHEALEGRAMPLIVVPQNDDEATVAHDAGFDSLMTAQVFLRLVIEACGGEKVFVDTNEHIASDGEEGGVKVGDNHQTQGVWQRMLPKRQDHFYTTFGNQIRANGTIEGVGSIKMMELPPLIDI